MVPAGPPSSRICRSRQKAAGKMASSSRVSSASTRELWQPPRGSPPTLRPHPPLTTGDPALVGGTLLRFGVKEEPEIARVPSALSSYSFKKNNPDTGLYLNVCFQLVFTEEISVPCGRSDSSRAGLSRALSKMQLAAPLRPHPPPRRVLQVALRVTSLNGRQQRAHLRQTPQAEPSSTWRMLIL